MSTKQEITSLGRILEQDDSAAAKAFLEAMNLHRDEALALAAEAGAERVTLTLLSDGANPNASIPPALVRAIETGHHALLDPLLEAGADLGSEPWWEDGDHPLLSAAAMADPIAMQWLCDKGSVGISDPRWLWDALSQLAGSRRRTAIEALLILVPQILERLRTEEISIDTSALTKAALKLRRTAKKRPETEIEAQEIASSLSDLTDEAEADEATILELNDSGRYAEVLEFVRNARGARRSRRAGLGLIWGISGSVWKTYNERNDSFPDPEGVAYLEELFKLSPDVQLRDDLGRTALMYAVRKIKPDLAQKLVDLGADLYAVDHEPGRSVLGWAKASAEPEKMVAWVEQAMKEQDGKRRTPKKQ